MRPLTAFLGALLALGPSWAQAPSIPPPQARLVVVSPTGDDRASGTAERPVATLGAALAKVRQAGQGGRGATIHLLPGTYRLPATLELGPEDSGSALAPLVIEGDAKGEVRLTGSRAVELSPLAAADYPARVPTVARGRLWAASLPVETWPDLPGLVATGFGRNLVPHGVELLFRREIMTIAGWPDEGYTTILSGPVQGASNRFRIAASGRLVAWKQEPDLWVYGFWNQDWRDSYEHVQALDPVTGLVQVTEPGPIGKIVPGQRVRVINALSELDRPSEWYLDRSARRLYFYPPALPRPGEVELTLLPVLIRARGARYVIFRGLTFDGTRTTSLSLQNVEGITVARCRFENIGGGAVDLVGTDSRIENCEVRATGEGGLYLTGGNRATLTPGNLVAFRNHIVGVNRWGRCYRPGIQLSGVGNTAELNRIENLAHDAILFWGNDHRIVCNNIFRVCLETGDAGAIVSGRDWSARGTQIEGNLIADVGGGLPQATAGIYLDDQLSGIVVRNNLIQRVRIGVLLGGGRQNLIQGNWFDQCKLPIFMDGRGLTWQKDWVTDSGSPLHRRLAEVPFQGDAFRKYAGLAQVLSDHPGAPIGNQITSNWSTGIFEMDILPEAKPWVLETDNRGQGNLPKGFPSQCDTQARGLRP